MEDRSGGETAGMEEWRSREQNDRGWQRMARENPAAGTAVGLRGRIGVNGRGRIEKPARLPGAKGVKRREQGQKRARLGRRPLQIRGDGISPII